MNVIDVVTNLYTLQDCVRFNKAWNEINNKPMPILELIAFNQYDIDDSNRIGYQFTICGNDSQNPLNEQQLKTSAEKLAKALLRNQSINQATFVIRKHSKKDCYCIDVDVKISSL
jgi:hypothetical protein